MRIISLVPSQTELLYDLGLDEEVIGITKFCIHPSHWFKTKTRVGGTKTLNLELIRQLKPTLIIANKEENERSQVEELASDFDVRVTDIHNLNDACDMIVEIGKLVGKAGKAAQINEKIRRNFQELNPLQPPITAAYFIWREPYMVAGGDTFINDMMTSCGL